MHIQGDIKVWSDGRKVCARLEADGPEGPIVIQASAPIGPVKRKMARLFARQGVSVSGSDPAFAAKVQQVARRKALKRLQRMAPGAFRKGGLGPYLAKQELLRRKKHRRAMARAGRPVGAKPVGRLPAGKPGARPQSWQGRLRARALRAIPGAAPRSLMPMKPSKRLALPARPTLLPPITAAKPMPSPRATGGGGGGGGGSYAQSTPAERTSSQRDDEGLDETRDEQAQGASPDEEAYAEDEGGAEADAEEEGGGDEGGASEEGADGEDEGGDEEGGQADEGVSGYGFRGQDARFDRQRQIAARRALAINRLRAAMRLLLAAHHDPHARRRIIDIAAMAGEGHPAAKKSFKALAVAHKLHKKAQARGTTKALATSSKSHGKALAANKVKPQSKAIVRAPAPRASMKVAPKALPAPSPPFAPGTPAAAVKWWDILAAWRRGMG